MLNSNKHKHSLQRAIQLLLAPIYSLLSLFIGKNDYIVLTSSLNNEFSDNTRALFEDLYNTPSYKDKVYFVVNNAEIRDEYNKFYPDRFICNRSIKNIFFILRARYWVCSSMELPMASLFQRYQRKVYHLGHGMPYKKIGLLESSISWYKKIYYFFITSNFTYTLATSDFFIDAIARGFGLPESRVILLPQPKTGKMSQRLNVEDSRFSDQNATHILYAPTWRPYGDVELFPFEDLEFDVLAEFLSSNNIYIWLRLHPRNEQDINLQLLNIANINFFSASKYNAINQYLHCFTALITDYSSVYFDYLTLCRPVLFFDYDLDTYNDKVGVIDSSMEVKCIESTKSMSQFLAQLSDIKNNNIDLSGVKKAHSLVNFDIDNDRIAKHVIERLF